MNGVFFILLALIIIYLSNKLSEYADVLSKQTKLGGIFIGGFFLAGITSLPELVTCISSIQLKNPYLAIGDIIGSNVFNIFIICVFDFVFCRKEIFNKTSSKHLLVIFFLLINYISIYLSIVGVFHSTFLRMGISSFISIILYILYIFYLSKNNDNQTYKVINYDNKNIWMRFTITAFLIIILSILLTITVNKISLSNPLVSDSFIGATLLGIVTSLPEIVTYYSLIKLNNYDLAVSDIIGSNLFNILILTVGDLLISNRTIYYYTDYQSIILIYIAVLTSIIAFYQNWRKKSLSRVTYLLPSLITICIYIYYLVQSIKS